jgi:hypothetical protein
MLWMVSRSDMTKKFVWTGAFFGSSIGGFVPAMWGGDLFSLPGLVASAAGALAGMWLGYRVSQWL